jgi:glycosyltransferase involved in cell wall biosynthesis
MRILIVGPFAGQMSGGVAGGVGEMAMILGAALGSAGVDVHVAASGGALGIESVTVHTVEVDSRFALVTRYRRYRESLGDLCRRVRPDVIHANGMLHAYAALHLGIPVVAVAHGDPRRDAWGSRGLAARMRAAAVAAMERAAIAGATVVVDVAPSWELNLIEQPHRFIHIPNPIDERWYGVTRDPDPRTVLYIGGARRVKGPDTLAKAWRVLDDACLRVVGWDSASALPEGFPTDVRVSDRLDTSALLTEYAQATCLAVPSHWEVAPLAVFQAWAAGLPVVSTDAGGLGTLPSDALLRSREGDPVAFGTMLRTALNDRGVRERLVAAGRREAAKHRGSKVAAAYIDVYRETIGRTR